MPAKPRMRSSDSANSTITSTWLPNTMRSGKMKKAAAAISQGSTSQSCRRWRVARYAMARVRTSGAGAAAAIVSLAAIEPRRPDEQDQHRHGVDEKAAGAGKDVLAGGVAHAEQDRGEQRTLEAAETADRDDEEEEHEVEHREARREPEHLDREPAAERRKPAAHRESQREQAIDIDADRLRHAPVVDRGADAGADIGALEGVPQHGGQRGADRDDEHPIGRKGARREAELAGEILGQMDGLRARAVEIGVGGDRHVGEADSEQHLLEFGRPVEAGVEQPLEH